jgi:hypothetical protein
VRRLSSSSAAPRRTRLLCTPAKAGPRHRLNAFRSVLAAAATLPSSACRRAATTNPANSSLSNSLAEISNR